MAKGTIGYKREHGLTIKQENAIDLLVLGETDASTAESVGVSRPTVTKWRNHDPCFVAELNRRRRDLWGSSLDRLRSLLPRALEALEEELADGKQRGRTAVEILRLAGLDASSQNRSWLEREGVGMTDAQAIIDARARSRRPDPLNELLYGEPVTDAERESAMAELSGLLEDA
jgi:hypothetical protein